jgi:hypothetical protein
VAVRTSAANQAYTGAGPTGAVATVLGWSYVVVDRANFVNLWVLHNGSEGTPEAGYGSDASGLTFVAYDAGFNTLGSFATTVGTWFRHALVMNGTAWTVYFGNYGSALSSASGTRTAISSPGTLVIGATGDWFNGRHAAYRVYDAALSLAEIESEFEQYQPIRTTNLHRYHPFVNAELVDYSGNARTLTAGAGAATTEAGPPIRWDARLLQQLYVPAASNVANPNAGSASIGMAGQNATVTRTAQPLPTSATIGMAGQNATVSTSVNALAGWANIILAEDNPTTTVQVSAATATFTVAGQTAAASTAVVNVPAGAAALGVAAQSATTRVSPTPTAATFTFAAQAATVLGGTNANPGTGTFALTARTPSASVKVSAGVAAFGLAAGDVISGNLGLACANLTATVTVDQHFGAVSVGDRHAAVVTVDAHESTVGAEEYYAVAAVCGRS